MAVGWMWPPWCEAGLLGTGDRTERQRGQLIPSKHHRRSQAENISENTGLWHLQTWRSTGETKSLKFMEI